MKVTMSLVATSNRDDKNYTRSLGNINPDYLRLTGNDTTPQPPLPIAYESFMDWVDAVGRGLASLSKNSYYDSVVTATLSAREELA